MIELTQICRFKQKPCKTCGRPRSNKIHREKNVEEGLPYCDFKRQLRCENCDKPKTHLDHMGAPPSFNVLGWGSKRAYLGLKTQWEAAFIELLEESGLPKGLSRVMVEAEVSYGVDRERDEDNAIALLRKFLGDAIQRGGWLERDSWGKIDFTRLERHDEPGVSRLRLVIFPKLA